MNLYQRWQNHPKTAGKMRLALFAGALIFPLGIPAALIFLLPRLDTAWGWRSFYAGWPNLLIGAAAVLAGGLLAGWTIWAQITLASGTPFPMLPTQTLIVIGPFRTCRNPMTLGTILAYIGIAICIGSLAALLSVGLFFLLLLIYLKAFEEKELEIRFGKSYLEYKLSTPFLLPFRLGKRW